MTVSTHSTPSRARRAWMAAAAACAAGPWFGARAQPGGRPTRILVAAPPGGTPDVLARNLAARMGGGGEFLVENRPGAAGLVTVDALLGAPADGSVTLLGHSGLVTMYPDLFSRLRYDPVGDLVPVGPAAETAFALAVGPAVPTDVRTVAEYVRWARADARRASYGTPGVGTLPHVVGALLARQGGFEAVHAPYGGGPPAINDLLGGRLSSVVLPDGLLRQLHQGGQARILATTAAARSPSLPGVPTLAEAGFPALVVREWWGLFVPRGTPASVLDALGAALRAAAASPEVAASFDKMGIQVLTGSASQMADRIARERNYWRGVLPTLGIRMD